MAIFTALSADQALSAIKKNQATTCGLLPGKTLANNRYKENVFLGHIQDKCIAFLLRN